MFHFLSTGECAELRTWDESAGEGAKKNNVVNLFDLDL